MTARDVWKWEFHSLKLHKAMESWSQVFADIPMNQIAIFAAAGHFKISMNICTSHTMSI